MKTRTLLLATLLLAGLAPGAADAQPPCDNTPGHPSCATPCTWDVAQCLPGLCPIRPCIPPP